MTDSTPTPSPSGPQTSPVSPRPVPSIPHGPVPRSSLARLRDAGQFVLALAFTLGVLAYLLLVPASRPEPAGERPSPAVEPVALAGPGLLRVDPGSALADKLQIAELRATRINTPLLTVTGSVAASLRPGNTSGLTSVVGAVGVAVRRADYWQFNLPEVLTTYTDWQKARADIAFTTTQRVQIKAAATARTTAQEKVVQRVTDLVAAGTRTPEQLELELATLKQYRIQEAKEGYEADTAVHVARRSEAALARQLQQTGLDPELLTSVTSDLDIVMADVPEAFFSRVRVGQACKAEFFGIPDRWFAGRVRSIAPVVAKEKRSLRVLFTIEDPRDLLRPGMFAEIGLGTDARDALLAPAAGVIHVGRADYLLVAAGDPGVWRVTPVDVGEQVEVETAGGGREKKVEVLHGLRVPGKGEPPDRVIGQGAILLKPAIVKAVQGR